MTVTNVVGRMYDPGQADAKPAEKESAGGFDKVMHTAVTEQEEAPVCHPCIRVTHRADAAADKASESAVTGVADNDATGDAAVESTAETDEVSTEVHQSAMYRFTMFVRISGDFGSLQESLVDEFKNATRSFVDALRGSEEYGVNALDGYLGKADEASSSGLQSSKSFLDSILSAADQGLKAITASMTSSSWMSGMNLSGSTSSLTSVSPVDIAKLQLQDALQKTSGTTGSVGKVKYGSNHELELIKTAADPVKVDSDGSTGNVSSAGKDLDTVKRDKIFDRFLQLIDSLSSSLGSGSRIVKAGFSFAYSGTVIGESKDAEKTVVSAQSSEDSTSGTATEIVDETEETVV